MRLTCLSGSPNKPCLLLRYKGVTLMLDCGMDMSSALHFLPLPLVQRQGQHQQRMTAFATKDGQDWGIEGELKENPSSGLVFVDSVPEFETPDLALADLSQVDAVLISNYTNLLSLPLVTSDPTFRGSIFLTEPTLQFGRLLMEETLEFVGRTSKGQRAAKWKDALAALPAPLADVKNPHGWHPVFTREEMESCLSRVTLVGYSEKKDIFGLLEVSPASSGYCLGSSNWIISSKFERIVYVSGSSTLTTHPRPMDQAPLRHADCLILTALTQTPAQNPDPMIGEFCKTVVETTRQGGNVLVPCYPSGITYDLFECLAGQMDLHGLSTIPLFFVSPVADSSLAYSNIMAEWLSAAKQSRVYLPEEPFPHGHLSRTGRLKSFRTLHDENFSNEYRQPCVMFCGHPSLRFGDAIHFIELWGSNPANAIVFTEPSLNHTSALAPFQPLMMKVTHCPIDTGLNFNQAKKLIRDLKPACLALPERYTRPPPGMPNRTELSIETDIPQYTYCRYDTVHIPLQSKLESLAIEPRLASKLVPVEVKPGIAVATITGNLIVTNNKFELRDIEDKPVEIPSKRRKSRGGGGSSGGAAVIAPASAAPVSSSTSSIVPLRLRKPQEYLYGRLSVAEFVQRLSALGITDARVEQDEENGSSGCAMIHLDSQDTLIQVEARQTHIISHGDRDSEATRIRIRDVLLNCLNKF